ncbi:unnamed protein product [Heterosigma akashiwo]|mmetsp:Transcript_3003/g.5553  ORF Transcript_3003/g.5553 Transcript_3003/m.5553 type:complete len:188 (+) Transcript_3003:61-624(+)
MMAAFAQKLYSFIWSSSRPYGSERGRASQLMDALPLDLTGEEPIRKNGGNSMKGNLTEIFPTTVTAVLAPVTDGPPAGIIHNREEERVVSIRNKFGYFGFWPDEFDELLAMVKEQHDHPYTSCLPNDDCESNEEDDSDSDDEDTLFDCYSPDLAAMAKYVSANVGRDERRNPWVVMKEVFWTKMMKN